MTSDDRAPVIEAIDAIILAVRDMARSVRFYANLGFEIRYGGEESAFTSFHVGPGYLNLQFAPTVRVPRNWGRVIFHVSDVDAMYARARAAGYEPDFEPEDAEWGERYFHIKDPDGHELSFAKLLTKPTA